MRGNVTLDDISGGCSLIKATETRMDPQIGGRETPHHRSQLLSITEVD